MKFKNLILFVFLSISFISCKFLELSQVNNVARLTQNNLIGMANPFQEVANLEVAQSLAGFSFTVPNSFGKFNRPVIRVIKNDLIEVIYYDSEGNEGLRIRKAEGTKDISGDYNIYETTNQLNIGNFKITEKRNGNKIGLIIWNNDNFSYSLNLKDAFIEYIDFENLISEIK